jgi:TonB-dependent starch-binding outer membrane protein SusC
MKLIRFAFSFNYSQLKNTFRIMKLSFILLTIGVLNIYAVGNSQDVAISVDIKNGTLSDLFNAIESNTDYKVFYKSSLINENDPVNVTAENKPVSEILTYALSNKNLYYDLVDKVIIITSGQENQPGKVSGKVTDATTGELLPGVTVLIDGTTTGVLTDTNGQFIIDIGNNEAVLRFSFVGYVTQTVNVKGNEGLNIAMVPDVRTLDEVVVIGYGTTTKKEVTGSITSVDNENFTKGNVTSPLQLLQGQVAGLNIVRSNGGDPNGDFEIQLRGLTTLAGGADPLIVVDGVIGGSLNNLSPEDIETIDVLKDGSAAAIYGTRGTNGVILISTKRAKPGKTTVDFNSYVALQSVAKRQDFLTADEFRQVITDYFPSQQSAYDYGSSTDWFKEVTRKNPTSQYYSLSSSGGTEQFSYLANIAYHDDMGLVLNSSSQKIRTNINVTQKGIKDKLILNYNLSYSTNNNKYADDEIMAQAAIRNPTEPVYDLNNETPVSGGYYYNDGPFQYYNPVAMIHESIDEGNLRNFSGNINGSFKLTNGLKINTLTSLIQSDTKYGHYYSRYYPINFGTNGYAEVFNNNSIQELYEYNLEYQKSFGNHNIQAVGGYSYNKDTNETYYMMNYGFDTDGYSYHNIGAGSALVNGKASMSSYKEDNTLIAFFGRVMYNYKEKYLLSASLRHEGSSRFGANHKWGNFPAVSLGWRLKEESFLKDVSFIDDLKLRAGYGITGNQDIGNYNSLEILTKGSNFYYNGSWISTYAPASNANPDLRWEKKAELNLGLDFATFDSRLRVNIDYYYRRTKDLLYTYQVSVPPYLYDELFTNVGTIDNKGLELTFNANPVKKKDFSWNTILIFSHNENNLVRFSNKNFAMVDIKTGYMSTDLKVYTERIVEGGPIGNFWGPKFKGFDSSGNNIFDDVDKDSNIDSDDNQKIGNAYPDFTFSWSNVLTYKKLSLSFLFRGSVGNDVLNVNRLYYEGFGYFGSKNILHSTLDHPDYKGAAIYSSRFIEDGSFIKLDNLTLAYDFKTDSGTFSKLKLYITGQNLLTITGYKGVDPEVSLQGLAPGIDWSQYYPSTRTFLVGLNVSF